MKGLGLMGLLGDAALAASSPLTDWVPDRPLYKNRTKIKSPRSKPHKGKSQHKARMKARKSTK